MKRLLIALFGFQIALGSTCMMNVSYAAELPEAAHAHVHAVASSSCVSHTVCHQETNHADHHSSDHTGCMSGNCLSLRAPEPVGIADDGNDDVSTVAVSPLVLQALLVIGSSQNWKPSSQLLVNGPPHLTTVVLRQ